MISENTLNLAWINTVSRKNRNVDKILIEKVIRALLLLEGLAESRLDFIFKGGTVLMLLQGSTKRLSIDIDIVVPEKNKHSKSMEIIKQLFDIGNLFDDSKNLKIIRNTFKRFALLELSYRNLKQNHSIVLEDIFETALCISTRGLEGKGDFTALQKGISQIRAFIFSETYQIEKAIAHASKSAYLSKLIELKENKLERFENALQVKDWTIEQPFCTRLNKLKKSNPQAFFYWYKTYQLDKASITY